MSAYWTEFSILLGGAIIGAACLTPFVARMIKASGKAPKLPLPALLFLGFLQNAVLFALVTALGLFVAHAVGLGAPVVEAVVGGRAPPDNLARIALLAVAGGGGTGLILVVADLAFLPRMLALLDLARSTSLWENFTASVYGGVNEELLTRLLGVSGIIWLLRRLPGVPASGPDDAIYWAAIIIMAIVFAIGHLPAAKAVAGRLSSLIVVRTLVLNSPIAVLCGWLFWRFGIEAAIIAHFVADIVYHVGGTILLHANDRFRFFGWFPERTPS